MAYLHGTFKDRKNNTIEVQIRSNASGGTKVIGENHNSEIFFSSDPIDITMECDDMFEHIIKKSCTINLITSIYLGDMVFAGNENDVTVKVFKNNSLIFSGFVEPNTYTQPYAYKLEEFTLNCIDYLSALQYKSLLGSTTYDALVADSNIYSFKQILERIGFNSYPQTYYDMSKTVNGQNAFDACGISLNAFLGESEDDVMTYEDVLKEILQYLNLHIIQEGETFYIFDWKSIENNSASWTLLFGTALASTPSLSNVNVTKDSYSSDATSLSMSDVYNQVQVKCELEEVEEVLSSPLDTDILDSHYDNEQLYMTEFFTSGVGESARDAFKSLILSPMASDSTSLVSQTDYDAWGVRDWFVKWLYNPNWKLTYKNQDVEDMMTTVSGLYVDQYKVMKNLREKRFFPALIRLGYQKKHTSRTNLKRNDTRQRDNYLVISCNGTEADTEAGATQIDTDNQSAANTSTGLLTYTSSNSATLSPTSSDITNYIVFGGKICLAPLQKFTTPGTSQNLNVTFNQMVQGARNNNISGTVPLKGVDDGGYYAQEFWKASRQNATPSPQTSELWMYPYIEADEYKKYQYNYSSDGSTSDTYNKIPILECQLKVGDKYLVENTYNLNGGKPTYSWKTLNECPYLRDDNGNATSTRKTTFTLGFDPNIGDYIIGNTYPLANTVNATISDEEGTAIPIKNSDALTGRIEFKIIGLVNVTWKDITRRHPTLFRHTKWTTNSVNLLQHTSAIWIKDFTVKMISDNGGKEVKSQSKDLIYLSDEVHNYIKKKDDIEFKINTMPTVQEAVQLGIKTTISYTNVINMNTNLALSYLYEGGVYDRAERLYINQYWNYYNQPKVLVETDLHNNNYSIFNTFTFNGFGKTIPTTLNYNVKSNNVHLTCRQL